MIMDFNEYKERKGAIESGLGKLRDTFIGEHGYPIGTAVKVLNRPRERGQKFHVSKLDVGYFGISMDVTKAKKDGTAAKVSNTFYSLNKSDLELWSDDNGL